MLKMKKSELAEQDESGKLKRKFRLCGGDRGKGGILNGGGQEKGKRGLQTAKNRSWVIEKKKDSLVGGPKY